jgi:hypothetical protein
MKYWYVVFGIAAFGGSGSKYAGIKYLILEARSADTRGQSPRKREG